MRGILRSAPLADQASDRETRQVLRYLRRRLHPLDFSEVEQDFASTVAILQERNVA